jgi:hypothetical protein
MLVLLLSVMIASSAQALLFKQKDTIAVFFDLEGDVNCDETSFVGMPIQVTAYLLLVCPTAASVQSWEARVELDFQGLSSGEWALNGGVNAVAEPDFVVDLGNTPLPAEPCGTVLLAQRNLLFFISTGEWATFWVSGVPGSTSFADRPGYWSEMGESFPGSYIWDDYDQNVACINYDRFVADARTPTPACFSTFWHTANINDVQDYDPSGTPDLCLLGEAGRFDGQVIADQELLDGSTLFIGRAAEGLRVIDPIPRDLDVGDRVWYTGTLSLLDGEMVLIDPTEVAGNSIQFPVLVLSDTPLADLAAAYAHVGGLVRLYGEVVSTDAEGFMLTDAGATLRVEIPASLGVDPTAYQPGQVLTVSGIFSIMNGKHLIVRDAAEIVEGNVANEKQSWGGVKALFR